MTRLWSLVLRTSVNLLACLPLAGSSLAQWLTFTSRKPRNSQMGRMGVPVCVSRQAVINLCMGGV